jgi:pimeloyl-ACP methyl ester carboxylesterase
MGVYNEALLADSSTIYVSPETERNGLRVVCYLSTDHRNVLIVFRGTVPANSNNLLGDLLLSLKQLPLAFHRAREVDQDIRGRLLDNCRITYLGHSLGAIHASLFACLHQTSAITLGLVVHC